MNKYFAHIKSNVPVSLSANGEYIGISSKRNAIDLLVTTPDLFLTVSPIGNYSPYTAHISNHSTCVDTTNNCVIVPYYNKHSKFLNHPESDPPLQYNSLLAFVQK